MTTQTHAHSSTQVRKDHWIARNRILTLVPLPVSHLARPSPGGRQNCVLKNSLAVTAIAYAQDADLALDTT